MRIREGQRGGDTDDDTTFLFCFPQTSTFGVKPTKVLKKHNTTADILDICSSWVS